MSVKAVDVVAGIIEKQGKILLARRPKGGDQADLWEFPGGKVETAESQEQALIRELREELGIEAMPACYIASHQQEVSGRIIHLHAWHVTYFHGEMTARCHSELCWCEPEQVKDYTLAPADIPIFDAFMVLRAARQAG